MQIHTNVPNTFEFKRLPLIGVTLRSTFGSEVRFVVNRPGPMPATYRRYIGWFINIINGRRLALITPCLIDSRPGVSYTPRYNRLTLITTMVPLACLAAKSGPCLDGQVSTFVRRLRLAVT